ncbi:MAG: class II fructose-bisphosphate aldolase, partial [Anaerovoracaceae bacterium]
MLTNTTHILKEISKTDKAVPAFNIFGYEDAISVIRAAEKISAPAILMTNKDAVEHMPLESIVGLLRPLAEKAKVPVAIHLDHAKSVELIERAITAGYSSVMYDGSALPFEENIVNTLKVMEAAKSKNISVEAEVGSVAYSDRNFDVKTEYTEPEEVERFIKETGANSIAVSVGSLHRMETQSAVIQYDRIKSIENLADIPLVIHGSSGIKNEDLSKMARTSIAKFNVGTALRIAFGKALREEVLANPNQYDRLKLFEKPMLAVE